MRHLRMVKTEDISKAQVGAAALLLGGREDFQRRTREQLLLLLFIFHLNANYYRAFSTREGGDVLYRTQVLGIVCL